MTAADRQAGSLALSQPLLAWLRDDPAWPALPVGLRWRSGWLAAMGSFNARLSAAVARRAPAALADPVLVVGPWRSGSTVMHELLTAGSGLPTPRTWQCMDPCAFALTGKPVARQNVARPMDGLVIGSGSPQEDEFALLALGVDSAYRAFWMPHRLGQLAHTLQASHWLDHPEWLGPWEGFLRAVLPSSGAADATQALILKSPNHTFRLRSILQRFPQARLVWMARDATQLLQSNRKMWTAMFQTHGLTQPLPRALDGFLRQALEAAASTLDWCAAQLAPERLVIVEHGDLLAEAAITVQATLGRLALPCNSDHKALQAAIARTAGGRVERYGAIPLSGELLHAVQALDAAQQAALRSHGRAARRD